LPPYIERDAQAADEGRYQTVYAKYPGAVAAPTAGLHFSEELLKDLRDMGVQETFVTLHVGAGTFQPVREEDLSKHQMHAEWFEMSQECADAINQAKREGRRVVAVGTTSLRANRRLEMTERLKPGRWTRGFSLRRAIASRSLTPW